MSISDNSKATSDFDAKSETLDYLYKEQLKELRELILKNIEFSDIEVCRKWLKTFNKITPTEKLARNCLCTLMQQQIKEKGYLSEPFTKFDNMEKNLEWILRQLDDMYSTSTNVEANDDYSNTSYRTSEQIKSAIIPRECISCYRNSNHLNVEIEQIPQQQHQPQQQHNHFCQQQQQQQQQQQRKEQLEEQEHQLQILRLQLTEKSIENLKLKEIAEKCFHEKERKDELFNKLKQDIVDGIGMKLSTLKQSGIRSQVHIFTDIFNNYSNDKEFIENLQKYDIEFHQILINYFRKEFEKRKTFITRHISTQYTKSKLKLRTKYEQKLKLQEKLIKLSCFSTLRQICIESYQEFERMDMWHVLSQLEQKYQNTLDAMHNGTHLGI